MRRLTPLVLFATLGCQTIQPRPAIELETRSGLRSVVAYVDRIE
jgi:hypothetical protein